MLQTFPRRSPALLQPAEIAVPQIILINGYNHPITLTFQITPLLLRISFLLNRCHILRISKDRSLKHIQTRQAIPMSPLYLLIRLSEGLLLLLVTNLYSTIKSPEL